jgi:hypothetical protein
MNDGVTALASDTCNRTRRLVAFCGTDQIFFLLQNNIFKLINDKN